MITVGAFEAKTHLSTLGSRRARKCHHQASQAGGPTHGVQNINRVRVNDAFEKSKALRKGTTLGGLSWKKLRDEGRP